MTPDSATPPAPAMAPSAHHFLSGKTALVTGSVQGIGLAIAGALAGRGANIVLHGLTTPAEGEAQAQALGQA